MLSSSKKQRRHRYSSSHEVIDRNPLPVNVSFSGGKDSLATLLVVMKAIGKVPILFADTGLEFPETYECVEKTIEHYGLTAVRCSGEKEFWETFDRDARLRLITAGAAGSASSNR